MANDSITINQSVNSVTATSQSSSASVTDTENTVTASGTSPTASATQTISTASATSSRFALGASLSSLSDMNVNTADALALLSAAEVQLLDGAIVTTTQLNFLSGVSSSLQDQLNLKAPLASPTFTGNPIAPTQSAGNNSTRIATTAYVDNAVSLENTIEELDDTSITSVANNELLQYNSSSSKWVNRTFAEAGVAPVATPTFTGQITHSGVILTAGTSIDQVKTSVVSMTVTPTFQDTNITQSGAMPTGTYVMLLHVNDAAGGGSAEAYYSAIINIYGGTTSADDFSSEVDLHRSGGSDNGKMIFIRTRSEADTNNVRVEMAANFTASNASNYTFKFRRLI